VDIGGGNAAYNYAAFNANNFDQWNRDLISGYTNPSTKFSGKASVNSDRHNRQGVPSGFSSSAKWLWASGKGYSVVWIRYIILESDMTQFKIPALKDSCSTCGCPSNKVCSQEKCIDVVKAEDESNFRKSIADESVEHARNIKDANTRNAALDFIALQKRDAGICPNDDCRRRVAKVVAVAGTPAVEAPTGSSGGTPTYTCAGIEPSGNGLIKGMSRRPDGYTPNEWTYAADATTSTPCKWKCDAGYQQGANSCVTNTAISESTIYPSKIYQCNSYISSRTVSAYLQTCTELQDSDLQKAKAKDMTGLSFGDESNKGFVFKFQADRTKTNAELLMTKLNPYSNEQYASYGYDMKKLINGAVQSMSERSDPAIQRGSYGQTRIENGELFVFVGWTGIAKLRSTDPAKPLAIDEIKITKVW
ncbi:MAG: hypothetical protein QMD85_00790, partial [Candidatus Aenigmarchaeota archaeon]|nr:hypothetical protein [Candidatus Aenigmarchaeota archaeon]